MNVLQKIFLTNLIVILLFFTARYDFSYLSQPSFMSKILKRNEGFYMEFIQTQTEEGEHKRYVEDKEGRFLPVPFTPRSDSPPFWHQNKDIVQKAWYCCHEHRWSSILQLACRNVRVCVGPQLCFYQTFLTCRP